MKAREKSNIQKQRHRLDNGSQNRIPERKIICLYNLLLPLQSRLAKRSRFWWITLDRRCKSQLTWEGCFLRCRFDVPLNNASHELDIPLNGTFATSMFVITTLLTTSTFLTSMPFMASTYLIVTFLMVMQMSCDSLPSVVEKLF